VECGEGALATDVAPATGAGCVRATPVDDADAAGTVRAMFVCEVDGVPAGVLTAAVGPTGVGEVAGEVLTPAWLPGIAVVHGLVLAPGDGRLVAAT
jgi:hypothetical protein